MKPLLQVLPVEPTQPIKAALNPSPSPSTGWYLIFRIYGYIFFERLLIVGFLVENQNIFALERYRPVVVWIGRETMTRDVIFFFSSKGIVASLNIDTQVSYSASKGVK
jgi:hypothetical protein